MSKQLGTEWFLPSIDDIVTLYKGSLSPFSGVQGKTGIKAQKWPHGSHNASMCEKTKKYATTWVNPFAPMLSLKTTKDLIGPSDYCKMKDCTS